MMAEVRSEWIEAFSTGSLQAFIPGRIGSGKRPRATLIGCVKEGEQNRDVVFSTRIVRCL
jgi:hypothetical protein